MEISQLIPHVEALIFAADRPLPATDILELLNNALAFLEDRATAEQVEAAIEAIQEKYDSAFYAFSVRETGGGYQFLTKKHFYQTVAQLNGEKFLKRLSTAALETLAIIAYRQPISKGEIEHIRGVSTDYSITKLLEKELIVISGRSEELPGKPLLYSTSKSFMDYFGLNSPNDLPKLKEIFEEDLVMPTQLTIDGAIAPEAEEELSVDEETVDDGHLLVVSESGELTETVTVMMDDEESDGLEVNAAMEDVESVMEGELGSEEEEGETDSIDDSKEVADEVTEDDVEDENRDDEEDDEVTEEEGETDGIDDSGEVADEVTEDDEEDENRDDEEDDEVTEDDEENEDNDGEEEGDDVDEDDEESDDEDAESEEDDDEDNEEGEEEDVDLDEDDEEDDEEEDDVDEDEEDDKDDDEKEK